MEIPLNGCFILTMAWHPNEIGNLLGSKIRFY